ncbi:MAG: FMN-binding negative transcriptional regulator [Chitinophagaceae bacterium]
MYKLPKYITADFEEVYEFMQAHPFITLTCNGAEGFPLVTHVPVLFEKKAGKIFLLCHVMRDTDHAAALVESKKAVCIFSGAHSYVSASWYEKKNVGSTWNYKAVHATGILRILNKDELFSQLKKLTAKYETSRSGESLIENMEKEYVEKMMLAIVGFEIEIVSIPHVFKLSQEKSEKDYKNIQKHLMELGNDAAVVANYMEHAKAGVDVKK